MPSESSKSTRDEREAQRKAAAAAAQQKQQAAERRRLILGGSAVGVVLIALVVAIVLGVKSNDAKPATGGDQVLPAAVTGGKVTVEPAINKVANNTGIDGVIAYDTNGWPGNGNTTPGAIPHNHVDGPVTYSITPPAGGDHNGAWMNAGVYTAPVPNEHAVHDLEHGAVWITYRPDLPASEVKALQDFVGKQSLIDEGQYGKNRFMLMSPWSSSADLPAPIVISSWGYQLYVNDPADPRLQQFVNKFRTNSTYTPEYGSAVDGVPVSIGGRAALYGDTAANPAN